MWHFSGAHDPARQQLRLSEPPSTARKVAGILREIHSTAHRILKEGVGCAGFENLPSLLQISYDPVK